MQQGGEMISFGAGVNSVAMTIMLVNEDWRGPIVFCDPGAEHPQTYCYLNYFQQEFLGPRGLEITTIKHGSEYHKRSDLSLEQFCLDCGIIPYLGTRWCSSEWKAKPLMRWQESHDIDIRYIGFSANEPNRATHFPGAEFPLIDKNVTRPECQRIIQRAGLELPVKSGCFFCPGQGLSSWQRLYLDYPHLFWRSVAIEENATQRRGKKITLDRHGVSLREHLKRRWQGQSQMNLGEWLPCICKL